MSGEKSELPNSTDEAGEPTRGTPWREEDKEPGVGIAGEKDEEATDPRQRLNETTANSRAGEDGPADGLPYAGPSHRRGVSPRRLRADPQGWGSGCRRPDRRGLRSRPGEKSPVAARPLQVGYVSRTSGPSRGDPEGGWGDPPDRDPDVRRQSASASGCDGAECRLRAGLPGLLVRLSAR